MNLRKLFAEFIGTFFLSLTVCMTAYAKVSADLQPLAVGLVLVALTYANGYISGALYNPTVTLAVWLRGKLDTKEMAYYTGVQLAAGAAAAGLTMFLTSAKPIVFPIIPPPQYFAMIPALLAELLGAWAMAWVFLNIATAKTVEGNSYYGLARGLAFAGLSYTFGSVSGGILNPAIALAATVGQLVSWTNLWIYLVGGLAGGALAALAFRYFNADE
jgi:aquaporin Z